MTGFLLIVILALSVTGYSIGRATGRRFLEETSGYVHSVPNYHGLYVALWVGAPALALVLVWYGAREWVVDTLVLSNLPAGSPEDALRRARDLAIGATYPSAAVEEAGRLLDRWSVLANGAVIVVSLAGMIFALLAARRRLSPRFQARRTVERAFSGAMIGCSVLAILIMLGIILCLIFEAWRFFQMVPPGDFFLGLRWEPRMTLGLETDAGAFGAVPVFVGTGLVAVTAMLVAVPLALLTAIHLLEHASPRTRSLVHPLLAMVAGVPTVVYGFFALVTVAPAIRDAGIWMGFAPSLNSALAVGGVTGLMILPTIFALSDKALRAVPSDLREGSLAVGATSAETLWHVILPAAAPGIAGAILLGLSRAIGETMIVLMAGGLTASLSVNPLGATTTMTAQIVSLLTGDTGFDSPGTLAAFALGLVLFVVTLGLNFVAFGFVRRSRGTNG